MLKRSSLLLKLWQTAFLSQRPSLSLLPPISMEQMRTRRAAIRKRILARHAARDPQRSQKKNWMLRWLIILTQMLLTLAMLPLLPSLPIMVMRQWMTVSCKTFVNTDILPPIIIILLLYSCHYSLYFIVLKISHSANLFCTIRPCLFFLGQQLARRYFLYKIGMDDVIWKRWQERSNSIKTTASFPRLYPVDWTQPTFSEIDIISNRQASACPPNPAIFLKLLSQLYLDLVIRIPYVIACLRMN